MNRTLFLFSLLGLSACQPGPSDTGEAPDDSGTGPSLPLDGFGALTGDCDVLDDELTGPSPALFNARLDLPSGPPEAAALSEGGAEILADGNLGGNSIWSEVLTHEVLYRCEGAALLKSEGEIVYDTEGKKTDLLLEIDGLKIGVSVVRAFKYPAGTAYELADATAMLEDKLSDILQSSANVAAEDAWTKPILGVIAWDESAAASVAQAWAALSAEVKADTVVWVTTTDGTDEWVYVNQ